MKTKLQALVIALIFVSVLSSCKKETDLTSSILGNYYDSAYASHIIVNKVDNNTVSIAVTGGANNFSFSSTKMNSETTFTLSTFVQTDDYNTYTYTGNGTHTGNNISLFLTLHTVPTQLGASQGLSESTENYTLNGTK